MVFCKAPVAGEVMTRLAKGLNEKGLDGYVIAAKIHEFLTLERLHQATQESLSTVELWCSPDKHHPFFKECENKFPLVLKEQPQGDLGDRMLAAFDDALSTHSFAVLIGTDCPGLDFSTINQALHYISNKQCSVIVPAEDGGYVLIGLSGRQVDIFKDMEWGSPQVCDVTLQRINGQVELLPPLWDLDRITDLERLLRESRKLKLSEDFISYLDSIEL